MEILIKRIGEILSQKGIKNSEEITLKILRIVFDEFFLVGSEWSKG